jgi:hypothetical protein
MNMRRLAAVEFAASSRLCVAIYRGLLRLLPALPLRRCSLPGSTQDQLDLCRPEGRLLILHSEMVGVMQHHPSRGKPPCTRIGPVAHWAWHFVDDMMVN